MAKMKTHTYTLQLAFYFYSSIWAKNQGSAEIWRKSTTGKAKTKRKKEMQKKHKAGRESFFFLNKQRKKQNKTKKPGH